MSAYRQHSEADRPSKRWLFTELAGMVCPFCASIYAVVHASDKRRHTNDWCSRCASGYVESMAKDWKNRRT
jgi:hypothetical protein